ncbi:hypothetical protein Daus18300_000880 [Diaporthe australafricana]|uniref:Uncharacterized protein n=1 Tax=Diaporthe australafricana TaxID=127596 RepID=A0ABR3Y1M4_9PEZI
MASINTFVKGAAIPGRSIFSSPAAARPAVMAPIFSRAFASESGTKKYDVPRTATGEVQKQTNLASEVGKKMQEAATGANSADSTTSGNGETPKQEHVKGGSK